MRWTDAFGILFGLAMFAVGAWFLRWAVFDGTVSGWDTLPDAVEGVAGPEGWRTVPASLTSRVLASSIGAVLMLPITWITIDFVWRTYSASASVEEQRPESTGRSGDGLSGEREARPAGPKCRAGHRPQ